MAQTSRRNPAIGGAVPTQYDLMLALARKIVNGEEEEEEEGESVEEAFAQAREAEAVSEELLVDEGWHAVEVEPEVLVAHRNGTAVTVEIEAANGQEADDTDRQQSLFSWGEFMAEEPAKPSKRNGKSKPASISMFEWALSLEQQREEEMVGARR